MKNKIAYISIVLEFFFMLVVILHYVDKNVGLMVDEFFHVPQGKEYCLGNFTVWDPKITTLPGLYIVSSAIFNPLGLCSTYWLRFTNIFGSTMNLILFTDFMYLEDCKQKYTWNHLLNGLNIALLPPLFFFSILYYTDVWSVTFVMLMVNCAKRGYHIHASLAGIFAVLMRQTNIIWVVMVAGNFTLDMFMRIRTNTPENKKIHYTAKDFLTTLEVTLTNGFDIDRISKKIWFSLTSYICVGLSFLAFLIMNNGIVIGDKAAHVSSLHIPQLFYFSVFIGVFGFPHLIPQIPKFCTFVLQKKVHTLLLICLCMLVININTLVHPYLLADNRHYTFYVWTRIYQGFPILRYLLSGLYIFVYISTFKVVSPNVNFGFGVMYILCTILVLIFQVLIDVRYFFLPFILIRLKFRSPIKILMLETVFYLFINLLTFWVFFHKEFYWENFSYPQRILW